jgi:hypothetical protein
MRFIFIDLRNMGTRSETGSEAEPMRSAPLSFDAPIALLQELFALRLSFPLVPMLLGLA